MKNIFLNIFIVVSIMIGFTSCKKEPLEPAKPQNTVNNPANVNPVGTNWELYSGRVFVANMVISSDVSYYDHFSSTKITSNLDIFTTSVLPIDNITQGITTWKFTSSNTFVLDGTTVYNYNVNTNGIFNVYGLENGSARNIEVLNSTADYMNVKIYESTGSVGTNDYNFYSVLTFVRAGFTGTPTLSTVPSGYAYNGVVGLPTSAVTLVGTKWVITKYQNAVGGTLFTFPNDTLDFISTTQYTINSSTPRNYNITNVIGSSMKSLSLYSLTTLGGDWSGQVQGTFMTDGVGVIEVGTFSDMFGVSADKTVWMNRIL